MNDTVYKNLDSNIVSLKLLSRENIELILDG